MQRISFAELKMRIAHVLQSLGMAPERAELSARLTAETDRDGVRTHGIARLPRFAEMVRLGSVDIHATPVTEASFGALERWDGRVGPGNLAAYAAMERACALAREHGVGAVGLGNTTHWMRAGSYGWQAADAGCAALCWTNTMANLPPWGAKSPALGNSPLVFAVPRPASGRHIVLDAAMSQFSYGSLSSHAARGESLPVPGGFDEQGALTTDPAAIERTQRALPIGFWKGSGLAFVLDAMAAALSGGRAVHQITRDPLYEVGLSQVFLAIAPAAVNDFGAIEQTLQGAIDAVHAAEPVEPGKPARYPGESTLRQREDSMKNGVPVEDAAWKGFVDLEKRSV